MMLYANLLKDSWVGKRGSKLRNMVFRCHCHLDTCNNAELSVQRQITLIICTDLKVMVPVVCSWTSLIFRHALLKVVQNFIAMFRWCCGHLYQARKWWSFLPNEGDHTIVETSLTINPKHLWGLCIPNIELVQLLESPAKQCQPIYAMYSWANM